MDEQTKQKMRKEFLKTLDRLFNKGMKTTKELEDHTVAMCTRVEDYNLDDNVVFTIKENKSYPTNYKCSKCKYKIVMSVWMKKAYQKAIKDKKKIKLVCNVCMPMVIKKLEKKENQDSCFAKSKN